MATVNLPRPQAPHLPLFGPLGRLNWWVIGAVVMVGISATLPVLQRSTATSEGFATQGTELEKASLNGEIRALEQEVSHLTSLPRIELRAAQIGLSPGPQPIYLTVTEPGPAPAKIPAEYLPVPVPQTDGPESWWRSILHWLPLPD
jgi:hypothetical protein